MWWSVLCVKMIDAQETQIFGQTLLQVCLLVYFLDEINIWISIWIKQTTLPSVDKTYPVSWRPESNKKADLWGWGRIPSAWLFLSWDIMFSYLHTYTWVLTGSEACRPSEGTYTIDYPGSPAWDNLILFLWRILTKSQNVLNRLAGQYDSNSGLVLLGILW